MGPKSTNRPGRLSDEDRALWRSVMRDATPLPGRTLPPPPTPPAPAPPPALAEPPAKPRKQDRPQAPRLRRGENPIEARLDLHGLTQDAAHLVLGRFIERCVAEGLRTVLVITGKGRGSDAISAPGGSGVLRRAVPLWLEQKPNADRVLAVSVAAPRHGGEGALYVLLRRPRR
jgi:DNA-nicking Smr family endonuclease